MEEAAEHIRRAWSLILGMSADEINHHIAEDRPVSVEDEFEQLRTVVNKLIRTRTFKDTREAQQYILDSMEVGQELPFHALERRVAEGYQNVVRQALWLLIGNGDIKLGHDNYSFNTVIRVR